MLPYRDLPTYTTDGTDLASVNRTMVPPLRLTQPPPGNALRGRVKHTTRAKSTSNSIAISFGKRQWSLSVMAASCLIAQLKVSFQGNKGLSL